MMFSTRGRYALRVIIDLAEHNDCGYIAMKQVAERQNISLKYLERIMPSLVKARLIEGIHGKGGGYRLTRTPEEYSVGEILRLTEGEFATVACLECNAEPCERSNVCRTYPMWNKLNDLINNYLDSVTIAELMKSDNK
ncbi:MAG: RrF2 family transcriptional regulator [Ruminococcus sp.]|nr:RrF2 family transcriptional regulator [Ruminococcus sp.]